MRHFILCTFNIKFVCSKHGLSCQYLYPVCNNSSILHVDSPNFSTAAKTVIHLKINQPPTLQTKTEDWEKSCKYHAVGFFFFDLVYNAIYIIIIIFLYSNQVFFLYFKLLFSGILVILAFVIHLRLYKQSHYICMENTKLQKITTKSAKYAILTDIVCTYLHHLLTGTLPR